MKGEYDLLLNDETAREAFSEYLSRRVNPPPSVLEVKPEKAGDYGAGPWVYRVKLKAQEAAAPPAPAGTAPGEAAGPPQ